MEIFAQNQETCEVEDVECLIELVDYCHRHLTGLMGEGERERGEGKEEGGSDSEDDTKDDIIKVCTVTF